MMAIINDILDLSKIEAGQLELEVADFDLEATIEQACALAGVGARAKGLALELRIDPALRPTARGDSRRLHQVLVNLVANAVKFTAEGSITVTVGERERTAEGSTVRVEVADTGIGIDPRVLDRMFEPFTQADTSTTRHYGGTGLGLAIARELVERMGGTIGAASEPGNGSRFWFELPLAAARGEADPAAPPAPRSAPPVPATGG
jgi:signal transduction histidine kinase